MTEYQGIYPLIVVILVSREASMDKTLFNSTLPVIITNLQQTSVQLRTSQTTARQVKSTPVADLQIADAQGPFPTRGSLNPSFSQDSLASSSSLESDVDPESQSNPGVGVE
jgi:hypothetical protein